MDRQIYFNKALNFLSIRIRTEKEFQFWLKRKVPQKFHSEFIEFAKNIKAVDDKEFARLFFESKILKISKSLIKNKLIKKGVSKDVIESVAQEFKVDEENLARSLLKKKYDNTKFSDKEKRKAVFFLRSRGFSFSVIKSLFDDYS